MPSACDVCGTGRTDNGDEATCSARDCKRWRHKKCWPDCALAFSTAEALVCSSKCARTVGVSPVKPPNDEIAEKTKQIAAIKSALQEHESKLKLEQQARAKLVERGVQNSPHRATRRKRVKEVVDLAADQARAVASKALASAVAAKHKGKRKRAPSGKKTTPPTKTQRKMTATEKQQEANVGKEPESNDDPRYASTSSNKVSGTPRRQLQSRGDDAEEFEDSDADIDDKLPRPSTKPSRSAGKPAWLQSDQFVEWSDDNDDDR